MIRKKVISIVLVLNLIITICGSFSVYSLGSDPMNPMVIDPPTLQHRYVTISKTNASIKRGEGILVTATMNTNDTSAYISWSTNNPSVATVVNGYIVGHSQGTARITVNYHGRVTEPGITSVTCVVNVSSEYVFDNGTYFIESIATGKYIDVETPYNANGSKIQIWQLTGGDSRKWDVTFQANGYYLIRSYKSGMYMGVSNTSYANNEAGIYQYTTYSTDYVKWSFMKTDSGNYALIPKSGEGSMFSLSTPDLSGDNGDNLLQKNYTDNNDFCDEWSLSRMSPLSGSEIVYGTGNWTNSVVRSYNNCYSYAINCQLTYYDCFDELLYIPQQPGDYYGEKCSTYSTDSSLLVTAAANDFNSFFGSTGHFISIDRYAVCPAGMYKVALVIDPNYPDYHWYRQDHDGLWSHKPGTTDVTRNDANGKLIIDPQDANRTSSNGLDYSIFVGYFAVTPWNYVCDSLQPDDVSNMDTMSVGSVSTIAISDITVGMTMLQVIDALGSPGVSIGYGEIISQYLCENGLRYNICYLYDEAANALVVSKIVGLSDTI